MNGRVLALQTPCDKQGCPALAAKAVCAVHDPDKIMARVITTVLQCFAEEPGDNAEFRDSMIKKLEETI